MTKAMPLVKYPHTSVSLGSILGSPEEQAKLLAHSLVIPFTVKKDGSIEAYERRPGEVFMPPPGSGITPLGSPAPTKEEPAKE